MKARTHFKLNNSNEIIELEQTEGENFVLHTRDMTAKYEAGCEYLVKNIQNAIDVVQKSEIPAYSKEVPNPFANEPAEQDHESKANEVYENIKDFEVNKQVEVINKVYKTIKEAYTKEVEESQKRAEDYKQRLKVLEKIQIK